MYTKQMAKENKELTARATQLLIAAGWNVEDERAAAPTLRFSPNPYTTRIVSAVSRELEIEFPNIPEIRVIRRVSGAMCKLRSR